LCDPSGSLVTGTPAEEKRRATKLHVVLLSLFHYFYFYFFKYLW